MLSLGAKQIGSQFQVAIFMGDRAIFGATDNTLKRALKPLTDTFGDVALDNLPIRPHMKRADRRTSLQDALELTLKSEYTRDQLMQDVERDFGEVGIFAVESADIPAESYSLGYEYILNTHLAPHLEEELIAKGAI